MSANITERVYPEHPKIHGLEAAIAVYTVGFASLAVLIPAYLMSRRLIARRLFLDDWVLLFSILIYIPLCTLPLVAFSKGLGVSMYEQSFERTTNAIKYNYIIQCIYTPTVALIKTAIILQLKRLFTPLRDNKSHWVMYGLIVANFAASGISFFMKLFVCTPREKMWNYSLPGKCISMMIPNVLTAVMNMVTDGILMVLLVIWTKRMNLSRAKKCGVAGLFILGCLSCISCAIRCFVLGARIKASSDMPVKHSNMNIWMFIHVTTLLQCATLPALPGLIRKLRNRAAGKPSHVPTGYYENQKPQNANAQQRYKHNDRDLTLLSSRHSTTGSEKTFTTEDDLRKSIGGSVISIDEQHHDASPYSHQPTEKQNAATDLTRVENHSLGSTFVAAPNPGPADLESALYYQHPEQANIRSP